MPLKKGEGKSHDQKQSSEAWMPGFVKRKVKDSGADASTDNNDEENTLCSYMPDYDNEDDEAMFLSQSAHALAPKPHQSLWVSISHNHHVQREDC